MDARPIIPYIGGKRRLAKRILPLMGVPHTCYVEPFAGAAAILFAKPPSKVEVLNDINGELVNLYRVVQHHLEEFCKQFKHALISRQIYEWMQLSVPETLTDIQRAARFFYLQKLSFGARVTGQAFGTATTSPAHLNLLRMEEDLSLAHLRLANVTIEHLGWRECLERYDSPATLAFCDPPYFETEGYGVDFPLDEYERLAQAARALAGRVLITVNDHPAMRRVFSGFEMETVGIRYTLAAGAAAERQELIIRHPADGWAGQKGLW